MNNSNTVVRRRGRPPKSEQKSHHETKKALLRAGIEILTEKGFTSTGLDEILKKVKVPKGSFYHFFESKDAFGIALIDAYHLFFVHKLDKALLDKNQSPLQRLKNFTLDAQKGMAYYEYRRGCLVGNLGQEMGSLQDLFRQKLIDVFNNWQDRVRICLEDAKQQGEIASSLDCEELAYVFWIGWEGAVLRAKLEQSSKPLETFTDFYFKNLK